MYSRMVLIRTMLELESFLVFRLLLSLLWKLDCEYEDED